VLGQARSTQRYEFKRWDLDQQLVQRMAELRFMGTGAFWAMVGWVDVIGN
jgi:hypothetical protein